MIASIALEDPGSGIESTILALFVVLAFIAVVTLVRYRADFSGLPDSLQRAKSDWTGAKAAADFRTLRIDAEADFHSDRVREEIAALFDEDYTPSRPTVLGASRSARSAIREAWSPWLGRLPWTARRLFSLAAWVIVFGLVAVSTDVVLSVMETGGGGLHPLAWPGAAISETQAVLGTVGSIFGSVPGFELAWALLVSFGILLYQSLFEHWLISGALLCAAGAVLTVLYYRWDATERDSIALPSPRNVGIGAVGGITAIWLSTLVAIGIGRRLGDAQTGVLFGTAIVFVVLLGVVATGGMFAVYRRRQILATWRGFRAAGRVETAYAMVRVAGLVLATLVAPLVPVYVVITLTKLPTLIAAWWASGILVKIGTIVVGSGTLVLLGKWAKPALSELREAVTDALARGAVRAAVMTQGLPLLLVALAYALFYGFVGDSSLQSILLAAVLAAGVGLIAQRAVIALRRAQYRAAFWGRESTPASRALFEAARLEDRHGREQFYLRVNGETELLHDERGAVADAGARVADGLCSDGEAPSTVAEWHAKFAFEVGISDVEETRQKLRERVRRKALTPLRKSSPREKTWWRDELSEFPEEIREERLGDLQNARVIEVGRDHVFLRNDLYAG